MKPRIELYLPVGGNAWIASHPKDMKAPNSEQTIEELFGTTELPTAFTAWASAASVVDSIRSLNPNCEVVLRNGDGT